MTTTDQRDALSKTEARRADAEATLWRRLYEQTLAARRTADDEIQVQATTRVALTLAAQMGKALSRTNPARRNLDTSERAGGALFASPGRGKTSPVRHLAAQLLHRGQRPAVVDPKATRPAGTDDGDDWGWS